MTAPLWVCELAAQFWDLAGGESPFPRDLRRPIARGLPLTVVLLPRLYVADIGAWLARRGVVCAITTDDRAVRACLVARYGHGMLFVDGADAADEQRVSLAHELAHFLRHYRQRRERLRERLGPAVLEVLDGVRPPLPAERIDAVLASAPIGYYTHLLDRAPDGAVDSRRIGVAEREADQLAFELLAPSALLLQQVAGTSAAARDSTLERVLIEVYGFPPLSAARYRRLLLGPRDEGLSLVQRLGWGP